jgi:hypothetical protein
MYTWLNPAAMANMRDVDLDFSNLALSGIRNSVFVVKGLGKAHYPEAVFSTPTPIRVNLVQRVEAMHRERVSSNHAIRPNRTWWQDPFVKEIVNMAISPYIDVRRTAQARLSMIARRYKKWPAIVLPTLIDALKDSDIDKVKGALHTLRLSTLEHAVATNWDYLDKYVLAATEAWKNHDRVSPGEGILTVAFCSESRFGGYNFVKSV